MRGFDLMTSSYKETVAQYVANGVGHAIESFGNYSTLAFLDKLGLKVGLVYNHFSWPNIALHIAVRPGAVWAHPRLLFHAYNYPFNQLNCTRVTAPIAADNHRCIALVKALGYAYEGTLREAMPSGQDLLLYGLLKRECRWLNWREESIEPVKVPAS